MAQAGIHGIVALAVRKWIPGRKWLMLGIVLGNILPDADNLAVAIATLSGRSTEGLHRTFTHSLFFVAAIILLGYIVAAITKRSTWRNLGVGLGIGVLMHILLDLLIWFNGVEILWPIPSWINFWGTITPPEWWSKLMMPTEFLFFALLFLLLAKIARKQNTDTDYLRPLSIWTNIQFFLFVVFTVLIYTMQKGFMTPFGAIYLLSLGLAFAVILRMRETIETAEM
ncbi:MAG: metal-dependent hydrolase [Anaerolineales bacterium]|nr:metal-dependent hydrolase [Anaerolineales bacterium]